MTKSGGGCNGAKAVPPAFATPLGSNENIMLGYAVSLSRIREDSSTTSSSAEGKRDLRRND